MSQVAGMVRLYLCIAMPEGVQICLAASAILGGEAP